MRAHTRVVGREAGWSHDNVDRPDRRCCGTSFLRSVGVDGGAAQDGVYARVLGAPTGPPFGPS
jgi:hypothetical protein